MKDRSGRSFSGGTMTADPVEGILAKLRSAGNRITSTRRATVEVLVAGGHLSAEEIVDEVRRRLPDVAGSTIYRTLTALEELGVVTHVHLGHGPSTFQIADPGHRHLVCDLCNRVVEVPNEEFAQLSERLDAVYGFSIPVEHFALIGRCRSCRRQHH
jgi:Fur family ferric uptake transcriptional regulator